jgi:Raf kinase inhibitor-like YbhB/YbcL family protein
MSEFSIICNDFKDEEEIPKKFGYKHGNKQPHIVAQNIPENTRAIAIIMDDPDAMAAVGKVWLHVLYYSNEKDTDLGDAAVYYGKNDFGEIGYGGPAPPDKRHTYIFKACALDKDLHLNNGFSKQELEDAMKGHILGEAKLTGTFAP